ncbi:MAG: MFS transporter [Halioglobus sp.]
MPDQGPIASAATVDTPYTRKSYRWYALLMLTGVYTFNFIDRQILVILQEPIKADLNLSDTQLGLLSGFAFALIYVFAAFPIARIADRGNRRNVVTVALVVWSAFTALSGFAQSYWHLLLARMGVAAGEAGCSPPAHSMISDIFRKEERATALAVYSSGINFGALLGLLVGGWIAQYMDWRIAFFVVGIPGIVYAVVVRLTVREVPRGFADKTPDVTTSPGMLEVARDLWRIPTFRHMALGAGLHAFVSYGIANFAPSFYVRTHNLGLGEIGTWLAVSGVIGAVGTFLGGYLTDRLVVRDARWYIWVPALSTLFTIPIYLLIYNLANPHLALTLQFVAALGMSMFLAPNLALTHSLVNLRMRAMSSAVLLFIINIIGLGLGPLATGMISDYLAPEYGQDSVRYALVIVVLIFGSWCTFHYWLASRTVVEDLGRIQGDDALKKGML